MCGLIVVILIEPRKIGDKCYCGVTKDVGSLLVIVATVPQIIVVLIPSILTLLFCVVLMVFLAYRRSHTISSSPYSRKKEKQALMQLVAIVITFIIGYLADFAVKIYLIQKEFLIPQDVFLILCLTSHGILRVCECLNPLVYYLALGDIQVESRRVIANIRDRYAACFLTADQPNGESTVSHKLQEILADQPSPGRSKDTHMVRIGETQMT